MKKKFFLVELPIYNIDIAVSVGQDVKSLTKSLLSVWDLPEELLPNELPKGCSASTMRRSFGEYEVPYCIRFQEHPLKHINGHGSISHEVLHTTYGILRSRGIELCPKTEEAYTYLNGHITREIYKHL